MIGLTIVWTFIAPYYDGILVRAADWLVTPYRLVSGAGDIYYYSPAGMPVTGIHSAALHFSLILLLSLLIATPGLRIISRLRNIGIGLTVMFVFHLVTLVLLPELIKSGGVSSPSLNLPVVLLSTIGLNLVPALVWVGLCSQQWLGGELRKRSLASDRLQPVKSS